MIEAACGLTTGSPSGRSCGGCDDVLAVGVLDRRIVVWPM